MLLVWGWGSLVAEAGGWGYLSYCIRQSHIQADEKNYGISELEALAVVWAVKHYQHYIYGYPCTVYTENEALKALLNTPQPSGKLARWGMALQELDLQL